MKEKLSAGDIIDRLAKQSGITKKLAAEIIRAIPEVIEEGLLSDGEAKVRGLGTFRLKTVAAKKGRNPKTGEEVIIPSHEKLVFLPEESFREQANEEYKFFGIRVLEDLPVGSWQLAVDSEEPVGGRLSAVSGQEPGTLEPETLEPETLEPGTLEQETPNSEFKTQNSELIAKRRNYWLIPVIIVVVAALSIVFYWRNFRTGSQFAVRSSQPEQIQEKPAATTQEEAAALDSSLVSDQRSAVSGQEQQIQEAKQTADSTKIPELKPQTLNLNTATVGTHLFQLAREVYGNPFLWVLIYRANQDKIKDPDLAVTGSNIVIPALEGSPKKLSYNDSLAVSDGYRLVYEYYLSKGDVKAEEFKVVMKKYRPD